MINVITHRGFFSPLTFTLFASSFFLGKKDFFFSLHFQKICCFFSLGVRGIDSSKEGFTVVYILFSVGNEEKQLFRSGRSYI